METFVPWIFKLSPKAFRVESTRGCGVMEALPLLLALHFALNATDVALFGGSQVVDHILSWGR
jgi:hypothetical protein